MKKLIAAILAVVAIAMLCVPDASAQATGMAARPKMGGGMSSKTDVKAVKKGSAWTLDFPLGQHQESNLDTVLYNYQRRSIPSLVSDAYATTGNLGAEGQTQIFFKRRPLGTFFFDNALDAYIPTGDRQKFYNVYIPTTVVSYNFGGGRDTQQDRLDAMFAGNVNRRIGVGAHLTYLYSKGSFNYQADKDFIFGVSGYYKGDRYEMQAFYNHFNMLNKENGGITDDLYITNPEAVQGGVSAVNYKTVPTRLTAAHTRLIGGQFFMNHAYNVGYWQEEEVNDTLKREIYIPVMKFIYSMDWRTGHHLFLNTNSSDVTKFWQNRYFDSSRTEDNTRYWTLSNTLGVSMVEGFKPWAKFSLSAYATYEIRKFTLTEYELPEAPDVPGESDEGEPTTTTSSLTPLPTGFEFKPKATQNVLYVGGRLAKDRGTLLRYWADAKFGLIGDAAGEIDVSGIVESRFRLFGDTVGIKGYCNFRNTPQPYMLQHYISNHFIWDNDFGHTRSLRFGGELDIPWTKTHVSVGLENLQNYVYFDSSCLPRQEGGNIQVFSASIEQKLRFGIWNWNNRITYQASSNQNVLPLPALAIYSNMFLNFKAFRVLEIQVGVDCDWYTRYRGVCYQPATMTFNVQAPDDAISIGNYPFCNAYLTCRLYKVRFYVMMSHVNQGLFGGGNWFSMPHYPMNPRRFQLGLSVDFAN